MGCSGSKGATGAAENGGNPPQAKPEEGGQAGESSTQQTSGMEGGENYTSIDDEIHRNNQDGDDAWDALPKIEEEIHGKTVDNDVNTKNTTMVVKNDLENEKETEEESEQNPQKVDPTEIDKKGNTAVDVAEDGGMIAVEDKLSPNDKEEQKVDDVCHETSNNHLSKEPATNASGGETEQQPAES